MDDTKLKYCRFCAQQKTEEDLVDFNVYSYVCKEVEEKLDFFCVDYVDLSPGCPLPRTICYFCNTSLNSAFEFFTQVKSAQDVLLDGVIYKTFPSLSHQPFSVKNEAEPSFYDESKLNIKAENPARDDAEKNRLDEPASELSSLANESEKEDEQEPEFVATYSGIPIYEKDIVATSSQQNNEQTDQSWSSYLWLCKFCDDSFTNIIQLREHSESVHDLCCAFRCTDCSENFDDFYSFVEHARGHRVALSHFCQYCNLKIENTPMEQHTETHTKDQPICYRCGQIFENSAVLKEHTTKYKPRKTREKKIKPIKKKSKVQYVKPIKSKSNTQYVLTSWEIENIEDKSWAGYPWTCQMCVQTFPDILTLRSHTKLVHGKCFNMKCTDCLETMDSYRGFVYHVRKHRPFLKQYCHYCNLKFATNEVDQPHVQQHFSEDQRLCECCGEIFPNREGLLAHIAAYRPTKPKRLPYMKRERPLTVDDFTCDVCNKVTKSVNALRAHKILHTDRNRDYTCDRCGKAFYTKGALSSHNVIHKDTEPEVCKICKKTFKTLLKLKHHVLTHKGEKPFRCEVCNRCFRLKNQMVHHAIIHTNQMPYQCQYCDKAFRHKNNLKTHENQHTGARPYACSDCGMDFTNWANCNKHMKRKHGTTLAKSTLTPQGKLPLNPKNGKPKKVREYDSVREWTELILAPQKRGKKTKTADAVTTIAESYTLNDEDGLVLDTLRSGRMVSNAVPMDSSMPMVESDMHEHDNMMVNDTM